MKNLMLLFGLLAFNISSAQQDSLYQGLLWEISGNSLEKNSYLYGTMHVSRKIAFNLDDVFFQHLYNADMVAVESKPDKWLDYLFEEGDLGYGGSITGRGGYYGYGNRNFYSTAFQMNFPDKMDVVRSMFGQYQLINSLLYRSEGSADFEEDTYLDMFIYQTGKRFNKGTYSLESHKESRELVEIAGKDAQKKEVDEWLEEMMEKKNSRYFEILQDAYRDRNIGLLDSINRAIYTDNYMEHMLFKRNENMVDSMETLMKEGSLFAGVGAAHLPGEDGMIDMLRKRGYTLRPIFSDQTDKGKNLKKKIEDNFIDKVYEPTSTADNFITLNSPNQLYELFAEGGSISIAPDYDNGSYLAIARIYTFNQLRKPAEQLTEKDLEKLLFEFIPGDIDEKEVITSPYPGFDIKNTTKTGNHQRYRFYVTPLEIIIIKMDGKQDFVKNKGESVFNSIQLNNKQAGLVKGNYGNFEVAMKDYCIQNNPAYSGKRFYQSTDNEGKTYSFFFEAELHDMSYIEEDSFELHYIADQFCENLDFELDEKTSYSILDGVPTFRGHTIVDSSTNKTLHLSTKLLSGQFYMAGYLGDEEEATVFFNSIKINTIHQYQVENEEHRDTNLYYTVRAPKAINLGDGGNNSRYNKKKKKKPYKGYTRSHVYSIKSNEDVYVETRKYNDWSSYEHIDSIWSDKKQDLDRSDLELIVSQQYQEGNQHIFEGVVTAPKSLRAIRFKYIQKDGLMYLIRASVDKSNNASPFVDTFFQTFTPLDTVIGVSPLSDKTDIYLKAIQEQDSILLDAHDYLDFTAKDFNKVKSIFLNQEFKEDWKFIKKDLLVEMCYMDDEDKRIRSFLEKTYLDSYENSNFQIIILRSLLNKQEKASHLKAMDLLEQDIPISDDGGDFLWVLRDSTSLASTIVPRLMEFSNIADYKDDIQGILSRIIFKQDINPKKYKSFKKQILNEAKIELKRAIGKSNQNEKKNNRNYYYRSSSKGTDALNRYINLLYPFKKDKNVASFLKRAATLDDDEVRMTFLEMQLMYGEPVDQKNFAALAENHEQHYELYSTYRWVEKLDALPDSLKSTIQLGKAALYDDDSYRMEVDSVFHLKTEEIFISGTKHKVHFYKKIMKTTDEYADEKDKKETYFIALTWNPEKKLYSDNFFSVSEKFDEKKKDETEEKLLKSLYKKIQLRDRKRINSRGYGRDPF